MIWHVCDDKTDEQFRKADPSWLVGTAPGSGYQMYQSIREATLAY